MRRMFQCCCLVHGDLSEYNLLWHNKKVYVIDVSQSVEINHPSALDFLKRDVVNITEFFKSKRVSSLSTRQLFEFVISTSKSLVQGYDKIDLNELAASATTEDIHIAVSAIMKKDDSRSCKEVEEAVFLAQFLPRSLEEVDEYHMIKIMKQDLETTYEEAVAKMLVYDNNENTLRSELQPHFNQHPSRIYITEENFTSIHIEKSDLALSHREDQLTSINSDEYSGPVESPFRTKVMTKEEFTNWNNNRKAAMKAHKKLVKAERREQRKKKIPKKDKRKAIRKRGGNKKRK